MLGLPVGVRACLFDLDRVLTQTAEVHAAAWKEAFDSFCVSERDRAMKANRGWQPYPEWHSYSFPRQRANRLTQLIKSALIIVRAAGRRTRLMSDYDR
jgi:beta-phosphoglucomutase-like phosphatase (HAD superfamily)